MINDCAMTINRKTSIINLEFTAMTHGGEGLARDEMGRVVFVPYVMPGETARVEIVQEKKAFARGRVVELLQASPHRVIPRCPHFGPPAPHSPLHVGEGYGGEGEQRKGQAEGFERGCGGCQWQHIAYDAQLEFKTRIVHDQFARVAKLPNARILPSLPTASSWHYRNNMRFVVNAEGALCLLALESHQPVRIRECYIMNQGLVSLFNTLEVGEGFEAVTLRAGENTADRLVILEAEDGEPPELETDEAVSIAYQVGDKVVPLLGKEAIEERIGERIFRISPSAFFQVNTPMAERLVALVNDYLEPRMDEVLLDAYGGVGLFGLSLAPRVARVIEIEENPAALEDARFNAREFSHVEFHAGRVEAVLPSLESPFQLGVVDPPRAGLARAALEALAARKPRVLVYVSCDPATLARDARLLVDRGYALDRVQPVDLFPQTYHIECVARFLLVSN